MKPKLQDFFDFEPSSSEILFISFSGLGLQLGMPMFEFRRALKSLPVNKLFFKDENLSWYLTPIEGWGSDLSDKVDFIHKYIDICDAKKVFLLGTSAGGFGAMMFANYLNIEVECLTFGPQVFLDNELRLLLGDQRWPKLIQKIQNYEQLNLSKVPQNTLANFHIIVGSECHIDVTHAFYYAMQVQNINIHILSRGGHNPAKELKTAGVLNSVLYNWISGKGIDDLSSLKIGNRSAKLTKV